MYNPKPYPVLRVEARFWLPRAAMSKNHVFLDFLEIQSGPPLPGAKKGSKRAYLHEGS